MSNAHWYPAFIGVGSNLESPADQVRRAIESLSRSEGCKLISISGLYQSPPLSGTDQPDYINAVVAVVTTRDPGQLLGLLQEIEAGQGRTRTGKKWESRTIDLDLLAFGDCRMESERLTLPHPGIAARNFVLLPWQEIAPYFRVPGLGTVAELADRLDDANKNIAKLETN